MGGLPLLRVGHIAEPERALEREREPGRVLEQVLERVLDMLVEVLPSPVASALRLVLGNPWHFVEVSFLLALLRPR